MGTAGTSAKLASLRKLMKDRSLDVYIVPSGDAHASEYCAPCDERRAFISGFTGSAGTAVISHERAALATDGRYFVQAAKELDSNWELLKQGQEDVLTWQDWATEAAEGGKTVGVDSTLISAAEAKKLSETISKKSGGRLVGETENLIDLVWANDRSSRPSEMVKVLDVKFAGRTFQDKIESLRKDLEKKKLSGFVVSMLDEIAWLFNLRGQDIPYNPVFFAYALITPSSSTLYLDDAKIDDSVRSHLGDRVQIRPYGSIFNDLLTLAKTSASNGTAGKSSQPAPKIGISNQGSWALSLALGGETKVEHLRSPIEDAKAIKNEVELEGMRQCHIRDGAALSEYFAWLEDELVVKKTKLDEVEAADKLESIRKQKDLFVGLSFDTISSTGSNAAVIHYKPARGACEIIDPTKIYLCDSGAQYFDGTTDTTRTLHVGKPTEMEIEANTLVLKGMIALDTVVFPKGTHGLAIDIVARSALFSRGLNYLHGTGHGVGSFLNVHEGPIGVGMRTAYAEVALSAGNVISNEPGYYQDGDFGIRIENIIMCREVKTKYKFGDKPWLGFEHVTMVPLCRKLIDRSLLSKEEIAWVNEYHEEVMAKTGHFFKGEGEDQKRTMKYLQRECAPL